MHRAPFYRNSRRHPTLCALALVSMLLASCATAPPVDTTALAQTAVVHQHQATVHASLNNLQTRQAATTDTTPTPNDPAPTQGGTPIATPSNPSGEGSLERASFDLAADWGPGHMRDDFEDPNSALFSSHEIGTSRSWYGNQGRYHISEEKRGRYVWFWTFATLANFYVDVVVINGPQCDTRDSGGLVFRGDQMANEGYLFGVTCGGQFHIGFKGGPNPGNAICSVSDLITWNCSSLTTLHDSDFIASGPGAMNRVGVYARGETLDFYVNGHWVYRISTADFANFPIGGFALYLGTFQEVNAEVSFDDFSLWSMP
jgi:hypothetical protein